MELCNMLNNYGLNHFLSLKRALKDPNLMAVLCQDYEQAKLDSDQDDLTVFDYACLLATDSNIELKANVAWDSAKHLYKKAYAACSYFYDSFESMSHATAYACAIVALVVSALESKGY